MGKASSSKKVARAARAGGSRRAGERRHLGFPATIAAIVILGVVLVFATRNDRIANASPRVGGADHWHNPYSVYTCVPSASTPVTPTSTTTTLPEVAAASGEITTTTTTTTTVPAETTTTAGPPTTVALEGDVPGQFQPAFQDGPQDVNGIHTHGDGVIHIHPFNSSAAGRNATLRVFTTQVGVQLDDSTFAFQGADGVLLTYKEGETKCQATDGSTQDGQVQVAVWDRVEDAANGKPPNRVVTSDVGGVRLNDGEALTIAYMPSGSRIPIESDVYTRFTTLTDVGTTTTVPSASSGDTTTTLPAASGDSTTVPVPASVETTTVPN